MKTPYMLYVNIMFLMLLSGCTFNANVAGLDDLSKGGSSSPGSSSPDQLNPNTLQKIFVDITNVTLSEGSVAVINVAVNPVRDQDTIINLNLNNGPVGGVRFNPIPSQVIIPAGSTSKSIVLNTIDDSLPQDQEGWNFVISSADGSIQADPGTLNITLNDNDGGAIPDAPAGPPIPKLLKEFNTYPTTINKISFNGKVYYTGADAATGTELWVSDGTAAGTKMLKDIEPGVSSSSPNTFFPDSTNTYLYFIATTSIEGSEVWRTDGTESGTILLHEIEPGALGSSISFRHSYNGKVYFTAYSTLEGTETYVTDGTYAGTQILINTGAGTVGNQALQFLEYNGELHFSLFSEVTWAYEIWKTNGTPAGTSAVVTKNSLNQSFYNDISLIDVFAGKILFYGYANNGREPYATDGTNANTVILKDIKTGSSSSYGVPTKFTVAGKRVITYSYDDSGAASGLGYYVTDGTPAGTVKIDQLTSTPAPWGMIAGKIIYSGCNTTECELYSSAGVSYDGTQIKDIYAGAANNSGPLFIAQIGNKMFFTATDGVTGVELYVTDGTNAGTLQLKDIMVGSGSSSISNAVVVGTNLLFTARSNTYGEEVWISDGTPSGTTLYKDLVPGTTGSGPKNLLAVNGTHLFFTASNLVSHFASVFISNIANHDALGISHAMVETLNSETKNIVEHNGLVYFDAMEGNSGNPLWVTNGTSAGTTKIIDLYPNIVCSDISNLKSFNGSLFFIASQEATGSELHVSNGTTAGTQVLKELGAGNSNGYIGSLILSDFGKMFFSSGGDTNYGNEIYVSDGTAMGTTILKDVVAGTSGSIPINITPLPGLNKIMFMTQSPYGIYVSDGTPGNATQIPGLPTIYTLGSIYPTPTGAFFTLAETGTYRTRIYFYNSATGVSTHINTGYTSDVVYSSNFAYNSTLNRLFYATTTTTYSNLNLWSSDGTVAGTAIVKNIPITGNNFQLIFVESNFNGKTIFQYHNNTSGYIRQLWITDGSSAGSFYLDSTTLNTNALGNYAAGLAFNGSYYFAKPDNTSGTELWKTDGTLANTVIVKDINPGLAHSNPSGFVIYNGKLYFSATNVDYGTELWRTDGTLLGTELFYDINPGRNSSSPTKVSVLAGKFYFLANKVLSGNEVWVYSE